MTNRIDAIELLLRDHRLIDGLAEQLDATDDPAEIRHLYLRIVEELAAHEAAEQEVVFPAFRATLEAAGDDTVAHRMGEHEEMNELLAEMRSLAPDCFGFTKRGSALLLEVKGHFLREEESVFDSDASRLQRRRTGRAGSRALAAKQQLPRVPRRPPATRRRSVTPRGARRAERPRRHRCGAPHCDRSMSSQRSAGGSASRWPGDQDRCGQPVAVRVAPGRIHMP